jgi:hypothetical protein
MVELRDLIALRQVGVEIVLATQYSLMVGSMPGMAASTKATLLFGSAPNLVEAAEKSFAFDRTCACTSIPMTSSQSCLAPAMVRTLGVS